MPVHYLLFEQLHTPVLVMTSGNISEDPIIKDDAGAKEQLGRVADAVLYHDREISNRIDDSVVAVVNGKERPYRRSRGYVPQPVYLDRDVEGIFAAGAELKNCFCIGKDHQAIMSQHIGDLKNPGTERFYREAISMFRELYRFTPTMVACDLHPDYLSTTLAREMDLPMVETQHHHAHVVSCMAEHGVDGDVIGISMDGTGYGPDHQIWGGEFLICNRSSYLRYDHFDYVPLPGMDKAVEEPWRMALVYLYLAFGEKLFDLRIPFVNQLEKKKAEAMLYMSGEKINTCMTSSAGRLFDAVAALLNICRVHHFEAEAPMRLEALLDYRCGDRYDIQGSHPLRFDGMFRQIVSDIQRGTDPAVISARFHHTLVSVFLHMAEKIRDETGINRVVLSGGTFQNMFLLGRTEDRLGERGFEVFTHEQVPANDGGIALGQLLIAAMKKDKLCV
jgi:hydrogenase maturation protein HypF